MSNNHIKIPGKVVQGHQVASQKSALYPAGTIQMQLPHFQALGLDLSPYYLGTLNVSISPKVFSLKKPQHTYKQVKWSEEHPAEDFSFSECTILYKQHEYTGLVYYPHPETKVRHFQNASTLEIIAHPIPGISYDDNVVLVLNSDEIAIADE